MTPAQNTTTYIQGFEDGKRLSVKLIDEAIEEAVKAEREACAKVCETYETTSATIGDKAIAWIFNNCSARIRARGNT